MPNQMLQQLKEKLSDPEVQRILRSGVAGAGIGVLGLGGLAALRDQDPEDPKAYGRKIQNNALLGLLLGGTVGAGVGLARNVVDHAGTTPALGVVSATRGVTGNNLLNAGALTVGGAARRALRNRRDVKAFEKVDGMSKTWGLGGGAAGDKQVQAVENFLAKVKPKGGMGDVEHNHWKNLRPNYETLASIGRPGIAAEFLQRQQAVLGGYYDRSTGTGLQNLLARLPWVGQHLRPQTVGELVALNQPPPEAWLKAPGKAALQALRGRPGYIRQASGNFGAGLLASAGINAALGPALDYFGPDSYKKRIAEILQRSSPP